MDNSMDKLIEYCIEDSLDTLRMQIETSELAQLEAAEVYLSVGDAIRAKGNELRKGYREKTADPQLTKHK